MIEHNPITGDPVIVATARAGRPNMYRREEVCPFCAGNESMTPPEVARAGEPWHVRAFPNKYPATETHEVVVESPNHDDAFDTIACAADAVQIYVDRYRALMRDAAHVTIFKNHGAMAGASIDHQHSQIIGTPFVPPRIEREAAAFAVRCALCDTRDQPLIRDTEHYRWIAPRGAMFAYEQWIVPKAHAAEIVDPFDLASLLQASSRVMRQIAEAYNWIFVNFPGRPRAHWYVQLFPRFAVHAGFELGSGSAIKVVDPEKAAARFR